MRIKKLHINEIAKVLSWTFLCIWILSILWFLTSLWTATNGFQNMVTETEYGQSEFFGLIMIIVVLIGVAAFIILAICLVIALFTRGKEGFAKSKVQSIKSLGKLLFAISFLYTLGLLLFVYLIYPNKSIRSKLLSDEGSVGKITSTEPEQIYVTTDELFNLTNRIREDAGLLPLVRNSYLDNAAENKAKDMAARNYWAHNAPDGTEPWKFIKEAGYQYVYAGENLAHGYNTSTEVVNNWMESEGHRKNILDRNYTEVGYAIIPGYANKTMYNLVVQMLGSPQSPSRQGANSTSSYIQQDAELATVRNYMNNLINVKASWEGSRGRLSDQDLSVLMDSLNRQIKFCLTIINNIENGTGSAADNNSLWNSVQKMGRESYVLTNKLNGNN